MDDSLFYIAGGALIVIALLVSLIGMRSEKFPSGPLLKGGILLFALLFVTTAYGAVQLAQGEQATRRDEANQAADATAQQQDLQNQQAGSQPQDTGSASAPSSSTSQIDAAQLFVDTGCGSCHTLSQLGTQAQGTIGPNLNEALTEDNKASITEMIVDPEIEIAKGYPGGTMPATYKDQLTSAQIDALAAYLYQSSH